MLFTWDTNNLCIVFRQWHIRSTLSLVVSLLAVVGMGIGYEALRSVSRSYEMYVDGKVDAMPSKFYPPSVPKHHPSPFPCQYPTRITTCTQKERKRMAAEDELSRPQHSFPVTYSLKKKAKRLTLGLSSPSIQRRLRRRSSRY